MKKTLDKSKIPSEETRQTLLNVNNLYTMKLIIAGGRDYQFTSEDLEFLDGLLNRVSVMVSGACGAKNESQEAKGADGVGELWANKHNLKIERHYPDWKAHGRGAGPRRNRAMAESANAVVLFPGGRGTNSMFAEAKKRNLEIFDLRLGLSHYKMNQGDQLYLANAR